MNIDKTTSRIITGNIKNKYAPVINEDPVMVKEGLRYPKLNKTIIKKADREKHIYSKLPSAIKNRSKFQKIIRHHA